MLCYTPESKCHFIITPRLEGLTHFVFKGNPAEMR